MVQEVEMNCRKIILTDELLTDDKILIDDSGLISFTSPNGEHTITITSLRYLYDRSLGKAGKYLSGFITCTCGLSSLPLITTEIDHAQALQDFISYPPGVDTYLARINKKLGPKA